MITEQSINMPNQPTHENKHGVVRFMTNPIVEYLLDKGGLNMNNISIWCIENEIDPEYRAQFAQLIGYSVSGWGTGS